MFRAFRFAILGVCLLAAWPAHAQLAKMAARGRLPAGGIRNLTAEQFQLLSALRRVHEVREDPQALVEFLDDDETEVRKYAIDLLVEKGSDSFDVLFESARNGNSRVRSMSVWTLRRIGPRQIPALYPLLMELRKDLDYQVRLNVCALFAWTDSRSVYPLIDALEDQHHSVRAMAADVLGYFKGDSEEAVPFLADMLKDRYPEARRSAALALGRISPWAVEFAEAKLIEALTDRDPTVRTRASAALGKVSDAGLPALVKGLGDEQETVRNGCAIALVAAGPRSVPHLVEKLRDSNPQVRFWSAYALGRIGRPAESAVPLLTTLAAEDQDSQVRFYATTALAMIKR
jgi:HEAT repeat protein